MFPVDPRPFWPGSIRTMDWPHHARDEVIPRVPRCGEPATHSGLTARQSWSPAFRMRVEQAMAELRRYPCPRTAGSKITEIEERDGRIVCRQACHEIWG